jgi:hypothetical protein
VLLGLVATREDALVLASLNLLYAFLRNTATSKVLLEQSGLFPQRLFKAKRLLVRASSPPTLF